MMHKGLSSAIGYARDGVLTLYWLASGLPSYINALSFLRPSQSSHKLLKIGGNYDGAYFIPDDLDGIDLCISPGVSTYKYFEDHLATSYGISSVLCDSTVQEDELSTPLIKNKQILVKKWVCSRDEHDKISLDTLTLNYSDSIASDKILQIDIEGSEYEAIAHCSKEILKSFRIIAIEVHGLDALMRPWEKRYRDIIRLVQTLEPYFACVYAHGNNCCGEVLLPGFGMNMPRVLELTLIRKDRLAAPAGGTLSRVGTVDERDEVVNVTGQAPILLNSLWRLPDDKFRRKVILSFPLTGFITVARFLSRPFRSLLRYSGISLSRFLPIKTLNS